MKALCFPAVCIAAVVLAVYGQPPHDQPATPSAPTKYLLCGALFDGTSQSLRQHVVIQVTGNQISSITPGTSAPATTPAAQINDLSQETCMPGLIDTHTHVLLQGDITAEDYDKQLLKESDAYRAIIGGQNAGRSLRYGFTTIRDLETEGAHYADVDIKHAIERGVIAGPRMRVATRALDVTGAYPLLGYVYGLDVPHGVQFCDGADGCRKAVREQISNGADWIKVYVDRAYHVRDDGVLDDIPTFTPDELAAIVDESHRENHPVAAHAMGLQGVHNAVVAGVDSIEHGDYIAPDDMKLMVAKGTWYVPTIYVGEYVAEGRAKAGAPVWIKMIKVHGDTFRRALAAHVKIAFGTDVGGFDWSINPAKEFALMTQYGMSNVQALDAATVQAARLLGMEKQIGTIEAGKLADIVATHGNPLEDIKVLEQVDFVMKDGLVYKP